MRIQILIFVGFLSSVARAAVYNSAVSAGTGSAGLAAVEPLDTPFMNPAALPYSVGYFFGAGYSSTSTPLQGETTNLALSLTDNMKDSAIPTTLGFVDTHYGLGSQTWERKEGRLAVGNYIFKRNALGFGVTYRDSEGPSNQSLKQTGLFLGSMFALTKAFSLGFVLDNLLPPSAGITPAERLYQTTSVGVSYNYKTFLRAKLDVSSESGNSWARPTLAAGLENYWNRWLIVRMGVQRNNEFEQTIASAGVGFAGPKFGLHYAFQNVQSPTGTDPRHSVDLGVPLW
jgi:hypothetical protein